MLRTLLYFLLSLVFVLMLGCSEEGAAPGGSTDTPTENPPDDGEETNQNQFELQYTGDLKISSSNQNSVTLKGNCEINDKVVKIRGAVLLNKTCTNKTWQEDMDLSHLPSGRFNISIEHDKYKKEVTLAKNTLSSDAEATYLFDDGADIGKDSRGSHDAQKVENVQVVEDSERSKVVVFNGSDSQIELSDGNFLNDAFSKRTISLWFNAADITTRQMLYEEGGSTNGLAIRLEAEKITVATRAGGEDTQEELEVSVAGFLNKWTHVAVVFNQGLLQVYLNSVKTEKVLGYTSIPSHGNDGGVGANYGNSNSFGTSDAEVFNGKIDDLMIFTSSLSSNAVALLAEKEAAIQKVDPLAINLRAKYDFSLSGSMGTDSQGNHNAVTVTDVTQETDAEKGSVARFNGTSSEYRLDDGSYMNDAFSKKSVAFWMKPDDLSPQQVLYDEGGSTNGMTVWLEDAFLYAAVRSGGSDTQTNVIVDVIDLDGQWVHVSVVFNAGKLQLHVNGDKKVERTAGFTEVASHSDRGGLGRRHGSDSSGLSGNAIYAGLMDQVYVFDRILSELEVQVLAGKE